MPAADVVLLPLCIGLTLLGLIVTALLWRRAATRGLKAARIVQGLGWSLVPVALYFSGLLSLLWNGVVALVAWANRLVFSPPVWAGLGLLVACVLLVIIGGALVRRQAGRAVTARPPAKAVDRTPAGSGAPKGSVAKPAGTKKAAPAQQQPPVDDDMAEIEAILKNRGIN